jgi:uracil-DNA glycosylase
MGVGECDRETMYELKAKPLKAECEGYGCIPADFMFVGISAGRLGALVSKVPFTKDASGRIFQRCLNRLGLSESDEFSLKPQLRDCYVTNLVKSRVLTSKGLNRLPTVREMLDWLPCFIIDDRAIHHTSWKDTMNTITARESIGGIDEEEYSDEELRNADA